MASVKVGCKVTRSASCEPKHEHVKECHVHMHENSKRIGVFSERTSVELDVRSQKSCLAASSTAASGTPRAHRGRCRSGGVVVTSDSTAATALSSKKPASHKPAKVEHGEHSRAEHQVVAQQGQPQSRHHQVPQHGLQVRASESASIVQNVHVAVRPQNQSHSEDVEHFGQRDLLPKSKPPSTKSKKSRCSEHQPLPKSKPSSTKPKESK